MFPVYDPPSSVALESELTWFLKERVVAAWKGDAHEQVFYIGEPSPMNKDTSLVLWAGVNESSSQLAVMLQLTITYYSSKRRKRFDVFLVPTDLEPVNHDVQTLSIDAIPPDMAHIFGEAYGSSKNRFLHLALQKNIPSRVLMPKRTTPKPLHGASEHVMLQVKAFTEAVTAFDLYIGYSTYAHQGLQRIVSALELGHTPVAFQLEHAYNHNGGGFNLWDDYLDTKSRKPAGDDDIDQRHGSKRKRARHRLEQDEGPPPYVQQSPSPDPLKIQVPASEVAASPARSTRCDTISSHIVPATPTNKSRDDQSFTLDPLDTPTSPPPPPFSPLTTHTPQSFPLAADLIPIANHTSIQNTLHQTFTTWLTKTQTLNPLIHEHPDLYPMLIAFGLAVQKSDIARFPTIKARATTLVLKTHVISPSSESGDWDIAPEKLVQRVVKWMCGQVINADEILLEDLALLMRKALDTGVDAKEEFLAQQARCIANFFVIYAPVLRRHLRV